MLHGAAVSPFFLIFTLLRNAQPSPLPDARNLRCGRSVALRPGERSFFATSPQKAARSNLFSHKRNETQAQPCTQPSRTCRRFNSGATATVFGQRRMSAIPVHRSLDKAGAAVTLNRMVKSFALDRTFAALADPTRRALIAHLSETETLSVSELARPFPVSLPAIMKHLDVLSDAGLIARAKTGRTVACRLEAAPMAEAMTWLARYQRFWSQKLDRLAQFVEQEDTCPPDPNSPKSPPSRSRAGSTRRPRKSSPPGRTRKR
jgi:DNA-binding transcriptional ArsR family regulator